MYSMWDFQEAWPNGLNFKNPNVQIFLKKYSLAFLFLNREYKALENHVSQEN